MENKYYLAFEIKPNNYFPINLNDLKIGYNFHYSTLEELDSFTLKYKREDIIASIREANLLPIDDTTPLFVIYYENKEVRKMAALTKEYQYDMWNLFAQKYKDKLFINKINNFLSNKIDIKPLKNPVSSQELISYIKSLPYLIERKLYFYLYEK